MREGRLTSNPYTPEAKVALLLFASGAAVRAVHHRVERIRTLTLVRPI